MCFFVFFKDALTLNTLKLFFLKGSCAGSHDWESLGSVVETTTRGPAPVRQVLQGVVLVFVLQVFFPLVEI